MIKAVSRNSVLNHIDVMLNVWGEPGLLMTRDQARKMFVRLRERIEMLETFEIERPYEFANLPEDDDDVVG